MVEDHDCNTKDFLNSDVIETIFVNNRRWASDQLSKNPNVFTESQKGQSPPILWIGCSDSRVPPNEICGLGTGQLFVHRNVANLVTFSDLSLCAVIQYAVEHLKVKHIIVCGHEGCGGIQAALSNASFGILDHWLVNIKQGLECYQAQLNLLEEKEKFKEAVRLNVQSAIATLERMPMVQEAWRRGQSLQLHGWIYNLSHGTLEHFSLAKLIAPSAIAPVPVLAQYPWLCSTSPSRKAPLGLWASLKQSHFKVLGIERAQKIIHGYDFPRQFVDDASDVIKEVFASLSDPSQASSLDQLSMIMSKNLAEPFVSGHAALANQNLSPRFKLGSRPQLKVTGVQFTYGPYPPPTDHIYQDWFSFITLVIPAADASFESHPRQSEILKKASEQGVFIRVQVRMSTDLTLELVDTTTQQVTFTDKRPFVDMEFMTPHFNPWDELSELDAEGEWRLRWKWRLSDLDYLIQSRSES